MMPEMSQDTTQSDLLQSPASPPSSPGAILALHREQAGLSVNDVSAKLKLSRRQIEALESDDYQALPGNTFVRGFVRNYARLLEIEPQPLVHYLDNHLPKEPSQAALPRLRDEVLPVLRPDGGRAGLSFGLAIVAGLGIVGLIAGAYWLYDKSTRFEPQLTVNTPSIDMPPLEPVVVVPQASAPVDATVPAAQPAGEVQVVPPPANLPGNPPAAPGANPALAMGATPAPASPTLPAPAPVPQPAPVAVPAAVPEPSTGDVRVVARQESWVQITDATGKRLVNELVPAGQSRSVAGKPPYRIRIGNGHQTQLFYKGKPTDLTPYIRVDVANLELN